MDTTHIKLAVLTGGIGSGKSTVAKLFEDKGAIIIDADQLSREVVQPGKSALKQIELQFGHKILLDNGELNRQALAELIFSDRKNREWLEMTLHPLIHTAFIEKLDCIRKSTTGRQQKLVLYVAPLYFEALHPSTLFSAIIVVNAPRDLCISRIMQRDSLSLEQACLRYDTQMPLEEKCAMATWVINNDSDTRSLQKEVEKVFSAIMKV